LRQQIAAERQRGIGDDRRGGQDLLRHPALYGGDVPQQHDQRRQQQGPAVKPEAGQEASVLKIICDISVHFSASHAAIKT
jgi:hypothetical protein